MRDLLQITGNKVASRGYLFSFSFFSPVSHSQIIIDNLDSLY